MTPINLYPVLFAAIASFIFGALWYSPLLFMNRWCKEAGVDPKQKKHPSMYTLTFSITLLTAFAFSHVMGPNPSPDIAIALALLISTAFISASLGINYQFSNKSLVHWLIDSGFHIGRFIVMALVISLWPTNVITS